ncbi:hypothetical protein BD413DRAFT_613645 [Trametes elegans]|nr:hypothetical protein BD413DRAFT_613645 [Trametes elegans]
MTSTTNQEHVVAFPYQGAWGPARLLINLSACLVQMKTGVTVTLLTSDMLHARAKIELARGLGLGEEVYARRVRFVSVGGGAATKLDIIDGCFTSFWEKLDAEKEIVCAACGECFAALPKPDVATASSGLSRQTSRRPPYTSRSSSGSATSSSRHGLYPILRNVRKLLGTIDALQAEAREVLTKAYGADGAEKWKRIEVLRDAVLGEWEEGGAPLRDVQAFLASL